jgi:hypothetical protein
VGAIIVAMHRLLVAMQSDRRKLCLAFGALLTTALGSSPAQADEREEAVVAQSPSIGVTIPANGATIPTNARLVVLGTAIDSGTITFTRVHADNTTETLDARDQDGGIVVALGTLSPGDTVNLDVECGACTPSSSSLTFTVGGGPDTTPPVFSAANAVAKTRTQKGTDLFGPPAIDADIDIPKATDDSGAVVFDIDANDSGEAFGPSFIAAQANADTITSFGIVASSRFCATVTAVDVAGNKTTLPAACVDVPSEAQATGCSSMTNTSAAGFVLFALGARRRRRPTT